MGKPGVVASLIVLAGAALAGCHGGAESRVPGDASAAGRDGATDFAPFTIDVDWSNNNAGTLAPDFYDVYSSTVSGGPYNLLGSVPYPVTNYSDVPMPGVTYYYVVRARKTGYDDSINSNEDSGIWMP